LNPEPRGLHFRRCGLKVNVHVAHVVKVLRGGRTPFANEHCARYASRFYIHRVRFAPRAPSPQTAAYPQIGAGRMLERKSRAKTCREQVQQILKKIRTIIPCSARASDEGGTAGSVQLQPSVIFLPSENGNCGTGNKPGCPPR